MRNSLKRENTERLRTEEAVSLVLVSRWRFSDAIQLTGADPAEVRRWIKRGVKRLPYVPTPAMIEAECRPLREFKRRRGEPIA